MSNYSVKKPITVLMGILIVVVLGFYSLTKLPLTLFPEINLPYVVLITDYQGASPEEVETSVSKPVEALVSTINNFKEISSMSNEHFGVSIVTFNQNTNMDTVIIELRELINNTNFPDGVGATRILKIDPDMLPVMSVSLFRTYDSELSDEDILIKNTEWIKKDLLIELQNIPGVADISISGEADVILEIKLNKNLLNDYDLDENKVLNTIEKQNIDGLIGVSLDNGELRMLYLGNKPTSLENIKNLPITYKEKVITLNDLAVEDGIKYVNKNSETYSKINGLQGIQISFQKQSNYNITDVTKAVEEKLKTLTKEDNEHYEILFNQGDYIQMSISSVLNNMIIGGVLAIIILFIFLWDYRPTLIVGLAIPISVIASFMLMYFAKISLNVVSMGGLALGIGMLVDNSIVVIENIYRLTREGKSRREAAIYGAKEVTGAIIASTLTTVAVFLPIVFVEGLVAEVFLSMAYTIAFSLGASLLVSLTLVPAMASKMLKTKEVKEKKQSFIKRIYEKTILFSMKYNFLTIILVIILLFGSFIMIYKKGFILLPETDEGTIHINVISDDEFNNKALFADDFTTVLLNIKDVSTVATTIKAQSSFGMGQMMNIGSSQGNIEFAINLNKDRSLSTKENEEHIEALLITLLSEKNLNYDYNIAEQNSAQNITGASGINIKISGYDLHTLEQISNDITSIINNVEGVINTNNGINKGLDNIKITVNKENAIKLGLTHDDIITNISYLYQNLDLLTSENKIDIEIAGVKYPLEIPVDSIGVDFSFDIFGDYKNFLSGVMLFPTELMPVIENYMEQSKQSIYLINAFLPSYNEGDPIKFIINPYLALDDDEIKMDFNPMSELPKLSSLALTNLLDEEITDISLITGFQTINTDGNNRYLSVTAEVDANKNVTLVSNEVISEVNKYLDSNDFKKYGDNYIVTFEGENEEIMKAVNDLFLAALVAILLVYMVMAIQFQSLLYPLIILGTIPLAFTGGFIALIITNSYLSLVSIMGLIILIGIVVNNGIVLIDYINKLREDGLEIKEAIINATQTRLRPILMTALTTILALFSLALGYGEGAELLQPMAITSIGGLVYATILTLYVVPTLYMLFNRRKEKIEK